LNTAKPLKRSNRFIRDAISLLPGYSFLRKGSPSPIVCAARWLPSVARAPQRLLADDAAGIVDIKNVKLLGSVLAKEQVQPDLEQLDSNMEENDENDAEDGEKKSVEKLGRLQCKLEYEFQKNEVRLAARRGALL